jgi:hypothetical protein
VQWVVMTVESSPALNAPPHILAEFEAIVQSVAMTVESSPALKAIFHHN